MPWALLTAAVLAVALPKPARVLHVPLTTSGVGDPTWGSGVTPTLDCRNYAGGDWACTGATFTAYGTPTAGDSPLFPSGFGAAAMPWAVLNGSTQYFDAGDILDPAGDFSVCAVIKCDDATAGYVLGKWQDAPSVPGWLLFQVNASAYYYLYVAKAGGANSNIAFTPGVRSSYDVLCVAYDYVADGSSILRANINGTVPTETVNAVGPVANVAIPLRMGTSADSVAGNFWTGKAAVATVWDGTAFSAAQLAAMVNVIRAHIGTAKEPLTVIRASNEPFQPTSASLYHYTGQNTLGVTSSGAYHGPALSLLPLQNDAYDNAAWVPENSGAGATVVTAAQADGWDGAATTADQIAVAAVTDNDADYSGNCQAFTATAAKWRVDIAAKTASGTANPYLYVYNGATYYSTQCSFTTAYSWCGFTSSGNLSAATWKVCLGTDSRDAAQTTTAANTVLAWRSTLWAGQFRPPPYQVVGTAVSVPATQVSTPSLLTGGPQDWCVYAEAKKDGSWATPVFDLWAMGTTGALNSASLRFLGDGNLYAYAYDGTGALYCSAAHGLTTDANVHTFTTCNRMGTMTVWVDGVNKTLSCAGGNTGIIQTMPATLNIGWGGASGQFGGTLKNVLQCPSADPSRCQP